MSLTMMSTSTAEPGLTLCGALMLMENDGFASWDSPVTTPCRIVAMANSSGLTGILRFFSRCFLGRYSPMD